MHSSYLSNLINNIFDDFEKNGVTQINEGFLCDVL